MTMKWKWRKFVTDPANGRVGQAVGETTDGQWFYANISVGFLIPRWLMRRLAYNNLNWYARN